MIKEYTYLLLRPEWPLLDRCREISRTIHSCVCFFGIMPHDYGLPLRRRRRSRRRSYEWLMAMLMLMLMTSRCCIGLVGFGASHELNESISIFYMDVCFDCILYFISSAWVVIWIYLNLVSCALAL